MAGHNKWSKIKHKKAKTDAQKGKFFSKMARELTMAAKLGGGDDTMNPRLRLAIQKAKQVNMPNENIKRAIQKGAGNDDGDQLEEMVFEAYCSFGVALIIEAVTDNKNRTVSNVKSALTKFSSSLATQGAVAYQFNRIGVISFDSISEDTLIDIAIDAGAEDVITHLDGTVDVICQPTDLYTLQTVFDDQSLAYQSADLIYDSQSKITLTSEQAESILKLVDRLEDDDDVQMVYGNYDIPDDIIDRLSA